MRDKIWNGEPGFEASLPLRFLFCFGEESASKGEFALISRRGLKIYTACFNQH